MQPDSYYEIRVGIVQFPSAKHDRFQAYKIIQSGYQIYLKDIMMNGGFDAPYFLNTFELKCNDETNWQTISVETSMRDKWGWFDNSTMDVHLNMLKELEKVGCKMIYVRGIKEDRSPIIDRIPDIYIEDFVCNIEWFKMLFC